MSQKMQNRITLLVLALAIFAGALFGAQAAKAQETKEACEELDSVYYGIGEPLLPGRVYPMTIGASYVWSEEWGCTYTPIIIRGLAVLLGGPQIIEFLPSSACYAGDWMPQAFGLIHAECGDILVYRDAAFYNGYNLDGTEFILGFRRAD